MFCIRSSLLERRVCFIWQFGWTCKRFRKSYFMLSYSQKSLLKTSYVGPYWLFAKFTERVTSDLKHLKNRRQSPRTWWRGLGSSFVSVCCSQTIYSRAFFKIANCPENSRQPSDFCFVIHGRVDCLLSQHNIWVDALKMGSLELADWKIWIYRLWHFFIFLNLTKIMTFQVLE